jgi:hypothetical protein
MVDCLGRRGGAPGGIAARLGAHRRAVVGELMTTWYTILAVAAVLAVASKRRGASSSAPATGADVRVLDYMQAGGSYFYAPEGQPPVRITREQYEAALQAANG